jgi:hypothetical protein
MTFCRWGLHLQLLIKSQQGQDDLATLDLPWESGSAEICEGWLRAARRSFPIMLPARA